MRRVIVPLLVVIAALAAGCSKETTKTVTLSLYEHDTQQTNLTFGRTGTNPGDLFVFSGDVFDHKGGTKLGRLGGHCETVSTGPHGESRCPGIFVLSGGQIEIDGIGETAVLFGGKTAPLMVVGGTGIYRNVRGDGTVQVPTNVPNQADANFVLHLTGVASAG
jgi:hypothetical protein